MKKHYLYVTFVFGGGFGALEVAVERAPQTSAEVFAIAESMRRQLAQGNLNPPPLVILNWREMHQSAPPPAIHSVNRLIAPNGHPEKH